MALVSRKKICHVSDYYLLIRNSAYEEKWKQDVLELQFCEA